MKSLRQRSIELGLCALAFAGLSACEPLTANLPDAGSSDACGGLLGLACNEGMFCNYPLTAQCGAADQTGTCETIPEVCSALYAPVCGCDDKTYGNACEANAHGVSVAAKGDGDVPPPVEDAGAPKPPPPGKDAGGPDSCDSPPTDGATPPPPEDAGLGEHICGGLAGFACDEGDFCDYGAVCNSIADGAGVCRPQPTVCTEQYAPVCGCDEVTYGNACEAHSKGVSILHDGECKTDAPGKTCGGFAALRCESGQFCDYEPPLGQGCDGSIADGAGVCQVVPEACTREYAPVCGCDGVTYSNRCAAHANGVSVANEGACKPER